MRTLETATQAFVLFKMLKFEVTNNQPGLRAPAGYGSMASSPGTRNFDDKFN